MNKEQTKVWQDACDKELKEKGYLPAEMAFIPTILELHEEGKMDISIDDEEGFTFLSVNMNKGE